MNNRDYSILYKNLALKLVEQSENYKKLRENCINENEFKLSDLTDYQIIHLLLNENGMHFEDIVEIKNKKTIDNKINQSDEVSKSKDVKVNLGKDFKKIVNDLNIEEQSKLIFETIGRTGLSRVSDLKIIDNIHEVFLNKKDTFNKPLFSQKIQFLVDMNLLDKEKIHTGKRGGMEYIYSLTKLGEEIYISIFNIQPTESEKIKILRQYESLNQGYFVKMVGTEFRKKGYKVLDTPDECLIKPIKKSTKNNSNEEYIKVDLVVVDGDKYHYIKCEIGSTSNTNLYKKLDKLMLIDKTISFVMPNNETLKKTQEKINNWVSKKTKSALKGYAIRTTTIDFLRKNQSWKKRQL